ncbi:hypothetical protein SpiGrapes_3106 [Sphaerochaeta pleomorpha str. Grapes]|uniref:Uncharacterized protein n=1 Tax=Sphaerochaeta pleomorpha (strain ATCC BAA-1885 / DSM 22778 / Grapes) TaxID=158190 RepID=G8QYZ4_SPHPG|nr:hypothetical protein SpiGrapes_3106 [Sphaerochaeta pleomorpha str. Grapes]
MGILPAMVRFVPVYREPERRILTFVQVVSPPQCVDVLEKELHGKKSLSIRVILLALTLANPLFPYI